MANRTLFVTFSQMPADTVSVEEVSTLQLYSPSILIAYPTSSVEVLSSWYNFPLCVVKLTISDLN